jgi:hypothetical protein
MVHQSAFSVRISKVGWVSDPLSSEFPMASPLSYVILVLAAARHSVDV